jgi:type VII secretion-associated serine protease mycosin
LAGSLCIAITSLLLASPALADVRRQKQWHLKSLDIREAHNITKGAGVTVAVVDSGVAAHSDIKNNLLPGNTFVPGEKGDGQTDEDGHGTMMAGLIAAHGTGNDNGVLGIAPASRILPVRISSLSDEGNSRTIAEGITWAASHGATVINISLVTAPGLNLGDAIKLAAEKDIVVVAGSGNKPRHSRFGYPAAWPGVLAVGASDRSGKKVASLTVTGEPMGICAPGIDIYSIGNKNDYYTSDGTSDATAIVSGAAALVRAKFPDLSAPEVIHRLQATATDIGKPGRDDECGFGVLNVVKALTAEVPPLEGGTATTAAPSTAPTATTAPTTPGTGNAAPKTTPTASNTPAIVGGGVIVLLFGGLIAFLVARRRKNPPTT